MRKLAGLQFKFAYKKGSKNKAADALSRIGLHFHAISDIVPVWVQEVTNSYQTNPTAATLLHKLAVVQTNEARYSLSDGVIQYKDKIWVAQNSLQTRLISAFHGSALGGHSDIQATYQRLQKMFYWHGMKQDV
jgi:hypothetical protein